MKMNFYKLTALMIVLVILLSACEPVLQRTDLQIKETQDNPATEPSPTTITVSEPQSMNQSIHGFGMGSSTNLRAPDIDQAYREMADMGVRYILEEIPMADVQIGEDFYDVNARWNIDRMIPAASKYGLKIVGLLAYGSSLPYDDDEHFLRLWEGYVRAVVDRYGENIDYWEIGNEMNSL